MPVVKPLPLRHAVQLALPRRPQVRNPRVQLTLERLRVVPAKVCIMIHDLSPSIRQALNVVSPT